MRRWLTRILILVGSLAGLMLASGLILQTLVSGSAKETLATSLSEKLGTQVTVDSAKFDLASWFKLRPAVSLDKVAIANPAGFGPRPAIEAKSISAQVALFPLLSKKIQVESIHIDSPRIQIDTNTKGVTNFDTLLKHLTGGSGGKTTTASSGSSGLTLEIGELSVTNGELATTGESKPVASAVDIKLTDFSGDRRCRLRFAANLFGGSNSKLKIDSQAGPFGADSLPIDGTLSLAIAPAEIPADIRAKNFGTLLNAPGDKARVNLDATIKGDVYHTLNAPAKVSLSGFMVGNGKRVLPLSGEFPMSLTAANLTGDSQFQLAMRDARVRVSKGEWSGSADVRVHGSNISGSSQGAIRNIDLDEFLGSFTTAEGKLQGTAELAPYSLQFAGRNAAEVERSLKGSAKLAVNQGHIAALDLVASIEKTVGMLQQQPQGADASKGSTPFTKLSSNLLIGESKIQVNDLVLDGPTIQASGAGVIGFDHALNFDLSTKVTGNTASLVNKVAFSSQSNEASVPLSVTGTVESPKVRPNVKQVVKQQVTKQVKGLVDSLFNRKPK